MRFGEKCGENIGSDCVETESVVRSLSTRQAFEPERKVKKSLNAAPGSNCDVGGRSADIKA